MALYYHSLTEGKIPVGIPLRRKEDRVLIKKEPRAWKEDIERGGFGSLAEVKYMIRVSSETVLDAGWKAQSSVCYLDTALSKGKLMSKKRKIACCQCGKRHDIAEMQMRFVLPDPIAELCPQNISKRCRVTEDLCDMDEERFFVRGIIPFRVHEKADPYCISAWAEVKLPSFLDILRNWDNPKQAECAPIPGLLANAVPSHEKTVGLKLHVRFTGPEALPTFDLTACDHLLALEQERGISAHRALEYTSLTLSPYSGHAAPPDEKD